MSEQNQISICPFIKASWDDTIRFGYPNKLNYCHKPDKAQPISLDFQERICLRGQDHLCPIHAFPTWTGELPWPAREETNHPNKTWMIAAIALVLLVFGFGTAYFLLPNPWNLSGFGRTLNQQDLPEMLKPSIPPNPTSPEKAFLAASAASGMRANTFTATLLPATATHTATATLTPTSTLTLSLTPTLTITPTPTWTHVVLILIPTEENAPQHPVTAPTQLVVPPTQVAATAVPPPPEEFPTTAPTDAPPPPPPPPDDLPTLAP